MTAISKITATLGLATCINDIHRTASVYAKKECKQASVRSYLGNVNSNMQANRVSYKDNERKNWLMKNNFAIGLHEAGGSIRGYIEGATEGLVRYLPSIALSSIAMLAKNKRLANFAAVGVVAAEVMDFIGNTLNLNKKDTL